jgi:hypothetical protein
MFDELMESTRKLIKATSKELDKWRRMQGGQATHIGTAYIFRTRRPPEAHCTCPRGN